MRLKVLIELLKVEGGFYRTVKLEHGLQFKMPGGEVVNWYRTGRVVVQGKETELATRLKGKIFAIQEAR